MSARNVARGNIIADIKISAAASAGTLLATDMVPVARSGDTSAYHGTMTQVATFVASVAGGVTSWNTRTGAVTLTTGDVTTALGYTPYNSTNPAGYQTAADVTTTLVPYAPLASPTFTGTPTLPTGAVAVTQTKGNNTTALATTAFVLANAGAGGASITVSDTPPGSPTSGALWWDSVGGQLYLWYVDANSSQWVVANNGGVTPPAASTTTPSMDGTAAVGTGTTYARADHVHPSDTSRAPLAAPVFTGDARAVTAAVGDNDTSIATTAFVQSAVAPALNNIGRNLLHNPLMAVAQRGAGPWTVTGYTLDRWVAVVTTDASSFTQTALTDADRAAIGDEAATVCYQNVFTGSAAAGALTQVQNRTEGVRKLGGKTITASFWAKAASGTPKLGLNLVQYFGSGGSPSAAIYCLATGASVTLATTWSRYSVTVAIPSTNGKVLGTNGDDYLGLSLWYSSGATNNVPAGNIGVQSGTVQLWGVQLEVGATATPLEKPDPQQDLAKCQRFFCILNISWIGYAVSGNFLMASTTLPVQMRATPSTFAIISNNCTDITGGSLAFGATPYSATASGTVTNTGNPNLVVTFSASADL